MFLLLSVIVFSSVDSGLPEDRGYSGVGPALGHHQAWVPPLRGGVRCACLGGRWDIPPTFPPFSPLTPPQAWYGARSSSCGMLGWRSMWVISGMWLTSSLTPSMWRQSDWGCGRIMMWVLYVVAIIIHSSLILWGLAKTFFLLDCLLFRQWGKHN